MFMPKRPHILTGILFALVTMMMSSYRLAKAFVVPSARPTRALSAASTSTRLFSTTTTSLSVLPRVKTMHATQPTDHPVIVKGWVKTIRKQKTMAFVQVNDGSNLKGIQCVVSFDDVDDTTKAGKLSWH
jgi:hypothetical protein